MYWIYKHLATAGALRAVATVFTAALLSQCLFAETKVIKYKEQDITVTGDFKSTGGGNDDLLIVWTNGTGTLNVPYQFKAQLLVVGGGGSGGSNKSGSTATTPPGGGGGGGEVIAIDNTSYAKGNYNISVGAGGAQALSTSSAGKVGNKGNTTSFNAEDGLVNISALGGGGGGFNGVGKGSVTETATGGGSSGANKAGGQGKYHNGGATVAAKYAGGGGGGNPDKTASDSDGKPGTSSKAGDGGAGVTNNITGVAIGYGGGGGGGQSNSDKESFAGVGKDGGGNGGYKTVGGKPGQPNTGGGGGGGSIGNATNKGYLGGAGGSGVVIIRITDMTVPLLWKSIDVKAGGNESKIFVDDKATWKWLGSGDEKELVITYTNASSRSALSFFDPTNTTSKLDPVWANARMLVIGGGGGGGMISKRSYGGGGGGGAGGFITYEGLVFGNNFEASIQVGAGGRGATNDVSGASGKGSSFSTTNDIGVAEAKEITALGGGGGGAHSVGLDGASGGGGSLYTVIDESEKRSGGAGTKNQGHKGGDGLSGYYAGGGGGGAESEGGDAVKIDGINYAGAGGLGKESDITGQALVYAGGGGGGFVNQSDLTFPSSGGAGGSGVGGNGAGVEGGVAKKAEDGAANTGSGGGGGISSVGAKERAGNGADGVVIIRLSGFVVKDVPIPVMNRSFVYDGTAHVGVDSKFYWAIKPSDDVRKHAVATNADNYVVTVSISPTLPTTVEWKGGGRWATNIPWKITQMKVNVPIAQKGFVFDNTEKCAVLAVDGGQTNGGVDKAHQCWTNGHNFCTLSHERLTHAGEYLFTATLVADYENEPNVTNFIWRSSGAGTFDPDSLLPGKMKPVRVPWEIAQAKNAITALSIDNWQLDTTAATPKSDWTWSKLAQNYDNPDRVKYSWRLQDGGGWSDESYDFVPPDEPGVYLLRATICKDSKHSAKTDWGEECGDWCAAVKDDVRFCVWEHPSYILSDYVDILPNGCSVTSSGSALSDFPVLVRLKEPVRDGTGAITGGLPGFRYADVRNNGRGLRFVWLKEQSKYKEPDTNTVRKASDQLLPYEIDTWNPNGESLVWVRLPKLYRSGKFRMYWRLRDGAEQHEDLLPSDTWANGYVGVWHLNEKSGSKLANSTALGLSLDATGNVSFVSSKASKGVLGSGGNMALTQSMASLGLTDDKFTLTGWYRADQYKSGQLNFVGNKPSTPWNYAPGWSFFMNNGVNALGGSANNAWYNDNITVNMTGEWHHLAYISPGLAARTAYCDGGNSKTISNTATIVNDRPVTLVAQGFSADEVRLAKTNRNSTWIKAEYDSVNNASYCTFGLVNRMQDDGARTWVNWWSTEPWAEARKVAGTESGRYWAENQLKPTIVTNSYFGALGKSFGSTVIGKVYATYLAMPHSEPVVFPTALGPYSIIFTMAELEQGTGDYLGRHVLYDGVREIDIEIVKSRPQPIDPAGEGSDAVNLRVLLGNDDMNASGAVTNQSYLAWKHDNAFEPPVWMTNVVGVVTNTMESGLLPGTAHALTNSVGTRLWQLKDVYLGNMMNADTNVASAVFAKQKSLPWSATSKNSSTNEAAYAEPVSRRWVGQMILRNAGENPDETEDDFVGAGIVSPWYTNGVGTIYFDAVNAFVTNSAAFRLQVEVSTNAFDNPTSAQREEIVWQKLTDVRMLKFTGSAFGAPTTGDCVELNITDGTGLDRFYRVIAPVNCRKPMRFRIRRVSCLTDGYTINEDDWHGFIVVDNVIASWPTAKTDLSPRGWFDARKRGKAVLGWETALSTDYPSAADSALYVTAGFDGDKSAVSSARCHYRWRYLDAAFQPERTVYGDTWQDHFTTVYLDVQNGMKSVAPLTLPGTPGDVEYYFDLTAIVPFYEYVDYSGKIIAKPTGDYSEEPAKGVTSRRTEGTTLASRGTDWFVRLREGASDYESIRVLVKDDEGALRDSVSLFLCEDHLWRGYLKTPQTDAGKVFSYRLEALKASEPGSTVPRLSTNNWVAGENLVKSTDIPGSPILKAGTSSDWAKVHVDAATGALLFQLDDRSLSLTISHADYQDFNGWSDAVSKEDPPKFTGSAIDGPKKTGVSSKMQRLVQTFDGWTETPETKDWWKLSFVGKTVDDSEHPGYKPFDAATYNDWTVNNAMWTAQFYHPTDAGSRTNAGLCVELSGARGGNIQLLSPTEDPRGIGSVTYNARVGQTIDFYDFNYSESEKPSALTNYTFITRAAFDKAENKNFAGNATLSVAAFYRIKEGCYEARWEQLKGDWNKTQYNGPARDSQRLCLYRWARNGDGEIEAELLGAVTNNANVNYYWTNDAKGNKTAHGVNMTGNYRVKQPAAYVSNGKLAGYFLPIYISARAFPDGTTEVSAGVYSCGGYNYNTENGGLTASDDVSKYTQRNWLAVFYRDTSAKRLKSGAYGVLSANCEAVFLRPAKRTAMSLPNQSNYTYTKDEFCAWANTGMRFNGTYEEKPEDLAWDWALDDQRMTHITDGDVSAGVWGIYAKTPSVPLELWLGTVGKSDWKYIGSRTVKGFGTNLAAGETGEFVLNDVTDHSLRLAVRSGALSDVVLTGVQFTQWRGDSYGDTKGDTMGYAIGQARYGYPSNFVFTSGIVLPNTAAGYESKVRLSAKRTQAGKPASVRAPLFDGLKEGKIYRGKGLGMISFDYANAQTNVNLLVQIATNRVSDSYLTELTQSVSTNGLWTTVTNFDFSAASATERRSGIKTVYLGLHGVVGVMRVVLDPDVVASVQSNKVTDTTAFGEIDITRMVVRDEPDLEAADWWGWNMRTVSSLENSVDDYRRTYLPDYDDAGLPVALNCSIEKDVPPEDVEYVKERMPFVQTPTFTNNIVGEVSFRARRYDNGESAQLAEVYLYGAYSGQENDETKWIPLHQFVVSNTTYEVYSFRAAGAYSAFRLAVTGVDGVVHPGEKRKYDPAVRVLIDEVAVFEAVNPEMAFRYVYPFRDGLEQTTMCSNVVTIADGTVTPLLDAQPLLGESWTVQAEIMKTKLPDELDMTVRPPRVIFHWYTGSKWGVNEWRGLSKSEGHYSAELALADGETMVFRGSLLKARDAIVGATAGTAPKTVQYSADVIYHTLSGTELTNSLVRNASTTWVRPSWYAPVDRNAGKASVAAYTILDTIAPHRVWINEANIWDGRDENGNSLAQTNQYVEIAVPEMQSLNGWRLDYLAYDKTTNTLCRFVTEPTAAGYVVAKKDLSKIPAAQRSQFRTNDYVFIAVQSPKTQEAKTWAGVTGAIDGTWSDFDKYGGVLNQTKPIGLRLVRPSGVVEQEIVLEGTNTYATGGYAARYSATNWIAQIEKTMPGGVSQFYYVGNEMSNGRGQSLGVVTNAGGKATEWTNRMVKTPGRVNEGQIIPYGYVVYANGEFMVVRAQIGSGGHVLQSMGDAEPSSVEQTLLIKKGGAGTNIVYKVADWWEIGSLTTNGTAVAGASGKRGVFTLKNVGAGASNDVTVVANARPFEEFATKYGLTEKNPYTAAVMSWLEGGKNHFGEPFENPGEIHLAAFKTAIKYEFVTNLDLTAMYWLDIDPTVPNWVLRAGLTNFELLNRTAGEKNLTHFRFDCMMEITNETSHVAYAPYVLRGLQPGLTSADYSGNWTSVTFKITGDLQNGVESRTKWVPLRWFVFAPKPGMTTKVGASASFDANYKARIDIWDPKDEDRAIWTRGWSAYPSDGIWFRWGLDDRGAPVGIETLVPDSTYIR